MMNKLAIAAGFAAVQVLVAHAAVAQQPQSEAAKLASFYDQCHKAQTHCTDAVKHEAMCKSMTDLKQQQECMCADYFWDLKLACDDCKMETGTLDSNLKDFWAKKYSMIRAAYCEAPATAPFAAAWDNDKDEPPAFNGDIVAPKQPSQMVPKSNSPDYRKICPTCSFEGTIKFELPTPISVINVATVTPSATYVASPVSTPVTVPTSAPFPVNKTTTAIVPAIMHAEVRFQLIAFVCEVEVQLCETCVPKFMGRDPRVVPNAKIESMNVAAVEKETGVGVYDAGWCSCVHNQVLPGTKVIVNSHICVASFDRVNECDENNTPAGSYDSGNDKPVGNAPAGKAAPAQSRKPLPGAAPFSPEQGVYYPAPIVYPPPGKEGKPASAPVDKGVVSNFVYGSEVFWPADRLPAPKATSASNPAAPASGAQGAAEPHAQDSTSPQEGQQGRPIDKTAGVSPAVPAGSAVPATAGVGCNRASAVLVAVAAFAAAL